MQVVEQVLPCFSVHGHDDIAAVMVHLASGDEDVAAAVDRGRGWRVVEADRSELVPGNFFTSQIKPGEGNIRLLKRGETRAYKFGTKFVLQIGLRGTHL